MDPPVDGADVSGDESVSRSASADRARGTRKGRSNYFSFCIFS